MGLRFTEADGEAMEMMQALRKKDFADSLRANIKLLFDTKKRTAGGMTILGAIFKTNDFLRYFMRDEDKGFEGYDYIITLDKMAWGAIDRVNRTRILRHELRHILVDPESKDPYKLLPHDVQDFEVEMTLNEDDPDWKKKVLAAMLQGYANLASGLDPYQGTIPGADKAAAKPPAKAKKYTLDRQKTLEKGVTQ